MVLSFLIRFESFLRFVMHYPCLLPYLLLIYDKQQSVN